MGAGLLVLVSLKTTKLRLYHATRFALATAMTARSLKQAQ
jgi:hypothetical protein